MFVNRNKFIIFYFKIYFISIFIEIFMILSRYTTFYYKLIFILLKNRYHIDVGIYYFGGSYRARTYNQIANDLFYSFYIKSIFGLIYKAMFALHITCIRKSKMQYQFHFNHPLIIKPARHEIENYIIIPSRIGLRQLAICINNTDADYRFLPCFLHFEILLSRYFIISKTRLVYLFICARKL